MGLLALASVISGAGEGTKEASDTYQKQQNAKELESQRQEMENLRQDKLIAAQKGMQSERLTHEQRMHMESLNSAKELAGMRETGEDRRQQVGIGAQLYVSHAGLDHATAMQKSQQDFERQEKIKDRSLHLEITDRTSLQTLLVDSSRELIRLHTLANDLKSDPTSAEYKLIQLQIKEMTGAHQSVSEELIRKTGLKPGSNAGAKPFVYPDMGAGPSAPGTPAAAAPVENAPASGRGVPLEKLKNAASGLYQSIPTPR